MDFSKASPAHEWTQIACTVVSRKVHTIYKTKRLGNYLDGCQAACRHGDKINL